MIAIRSRIWSCSIAGTGRFSSLLLDLQNYTVLSYAFLICTFSKFLEDLWALSTSSKIEIACWKQITWDTLGLTCTTGTTPLEPRLWAAEWGAGGANSNPPLLAAERPAQNPSNPSGMFRWLKAVVAFPIIPLSWLYVYSICIFQDRMCLQVLFPIKFLWEQILDCRNVERLRIRSFEADDRCPGMLESTWSWEDRIVRVRGCDGSMSFRCATCARPGSNKSPEEGNPSQASRRSLYLSMSQC